MAHIIWDMKIINDAKIFKPQRRVRSYGYH